MRQNGRSCSSAGAALVKGGIASQLSHIPLLTVDLCTYMGESKSRANGMNACTKTPKTRASMSPILQKAPRPHCLCIDAPSLEVEGGVDTRADGNYLPSSSQKYLQVHRRFQGEFQEALL